MPQVRLHDTRHTCATAMHLQGVSIALGAAWRGHADVSFTLRTYVHAQPGDLHVEFGLTHPDCYQLSYGRGRSGITTSAARETIVLLQGAICRLADQGYLRMSVERATQLFHSLPN